MLKEIAEMLKNVGIPIAYRVFNNPINPPFLVYYNGRNENFSADGQVYYSAKSITVELYTDTKDMELEDKVESALSSFFWTKEETYIDDEKMFMITYETEV